MFKILYDRYKLWIWAILTLLIGSSIVTKSLTGGAPWEVAINIAATLICLTVFLVLWNRRK